MIEKEESANKKEMDSMHESESTSGENTGSSVDKETLSAAQRIPGNTPFIERLEAAYEDAKNMAHPGLKENDGSQLDTDPLRARFVAHMSDSAEIRVNQKLADVKDIVEGTKKQLDEATPQEVEDILELAPYAVSGSALEVRLARDKANEIQTAASNLYDVNPDSAHDMLDKILERRANKSTSSDDPA
jgi:hypothetical protein